MSSFLITGGACFIGTNLVRHLSKNPEHRIVVVDDLSTGNPGNLPDTPKVELIVGDVAEETFLREVVHGYPVDYVIHLAAITSVAASYENFVRSHAVNNGALVRLLAAVAESRTPPRLLFASSAAVYGDHPDSPCRELDPCAPLSPYGLDKLACEGYLREIGGRYGIPYTIARFFNVYGPFQDPASPYSGVVSIFAKQFLTEASPRLKVFGDGRQTRDFVYVGDLVRIICHLLEDPRAENQVLNLGTAQQTSILELASHFAEIQGKSFEIEFNPRRQGDIQASCADTSRLEALGQRAGTSMRDGLAEYMSFETLLMSQPARDGQA